MLQPPPLLTTSWLRAPLDVEDWMGDCSIGCVELLRVRLYCNCPPEAMLADCSIGVNELDFQYCLTHQILRVEDQRALQGVKTS